MASSSAHPIFLDRNTTALLLVDHQVGLLSGVRDIRTADLKTNLVGLAKACQLLGVPILATNVAPETWGPMLPEVLQAVPRLSIINRTSVNAWDEPRVVAAVKATGRSQLLVAGISLEVCAAFPAISARAAGYDARVVVDASGTFNEAKRETGLNRLALAGVPTVDTATAAVEMLRDNADPLAGPVYGALGMDFATLVWQLKNLK